MSAVSSASDILELAHSLASRREYPEPARLAEFSEAAILALSLEPSDIRPRSSSNNPGGFVRVASPYVAILPDLHARSSLLADFLGSVSPVDSRTRLIDLIQDGRLTLVCLGDILHSEGNLGAERWGGAAKSLESGHGLNGILSPEMDEEMAASLGALCLVMALKARFGGRFHCLKGNHDNIGNSGTNGDFPFFKYALEGAMGAEWFRLRYGEALMKRIRQYELLLPLVAVGNWFCASHAEPAFPLREADLLDYRARADVVKALIWTGNGQAEENAVSESLKVLLGASINDRRCLWISGHRPVQGAYALRAGGRLVQIHNVDRRQAAWIENGAEGVSAGVSLYEIANGGGEMTLADKVPPFHLDHSASRH